MNEVINNKNKIDRSFVGSMFIIAGIIIITTLEWHFFDWYQACTRYGTLITFFSLSGAFFCYVQIKDALKDRLFWLMVFTDAVALANLFLIGSNKGSILIVVDFMLILYLSDKIRFTEKQTYFILSYIAFFFFYWTIDVKGYFKGYNTNYGGLILISGFACLFIILQMFNEKLSFEYGKFCGEYGDKEGRKYWIKRFWWYPVLYLFLVALAFNIISWYRSRTALMGLLALLIIAIIPGKIISNKYVFNVISFAATFGAIAFTWVYILLGKLSGDEGIQLFYKDIISGRNEIWTELIGEFTRHPLTGIGSSYEMKLDYMSGMIECHSAMVDILVVHGILVFVCLCGLLMYRVSGLKKQTERSSVGKAIFAAIVCVLITGFFENYYIVQPFSLILLVLLTIKPDADAGLSTE